jgi:multidrug efflux pump subunit AcrA (membrane-fusion protein)
MLFTGVSTIFFNINPLIKIDGYFALTSIVELPELREDSFRYLGAWVQNRVLRLPVEVPTLSRRKRRIYWIYGVLALLYTTVIMRFIGGLFYNFYSKYFPNVAVVLLLLTLYRVFRKRVRLFTRTAHLTYLDKKDLIMSPKSRRPLIAAGAVLLVLLLLPWTHRTVRAPIVLTAATRASLEAPEDAVVIDVLAREGDLVAPGQPLLLLSSASAEAAGAAHGIERERREREAGGARGTGQPGRAFEAEIRQASMESALASDAARHDQLVVKSPVNGRVLTPRLEDLRGTYVAKGTVLAEVGDTRRLRADIQISERLLDDLAPGETVVAMLPGRPLASARGQIVSVSPATLSHPVTATADEPIPPGLFPEKFVAVAVFDNGDGSLMPGMAGKAKIYARRASPLSNLWRLMRRWLQTIFW